MPSPQQLLKERAGGISPLLQRVWRDPRCVCDLQEKHKAKRGEGRAALTGHLERTEKGKKGEKRRAVVTRLDNPSVEPSECCRWNVNLSWPCSACTRDECESNAVSCLIKGLGLSQYACVPGGSVLQFLKLHSSLPALFAWRFLHVV